MKNGHKEIYTAPQMVDCPECEGKGTKDYPPKYINGDLYHDGETLDCPFCEGKKKITLEELEDWSE